MRPLLLALAVTSLSFAAAPAQASSLVDVAESRARLYAQNEQIRTPRAGTYEVRGCKRISRKKASCRYVLPIWNELETEFAKVCRRKVVVRRTGRPIPHDVRSRLVKLGCS